VYDIIINKEADDNLCQYFHTLFTKEDITDLTVTVMLGNTPF